MPKRRRAIVVQGDHRFMSAFVDPATVRVLKVGERIRVTKDLEIDTMGVVSAGEEGTVATVYPDGHIDIMFDHVVPALHEWRNVLLLAPFETDDWTEGLMLVSVLEHKELTQQPEHCAI